MAIITKENSVSKQNKKALNTIATELPPSNLCYHLWLSFFCFTATPATLLGALVLTKRFKQSISIDAAKNHADKRTTQLTNFIVTHT